MKNNRDKNIYEMLNDIEIDLSDFERDDFNDLEKMKIKKKFRTSIGKKKTTKKYIAVASMAIISFGFIAITPVGTYASKIISDLVFDIKSVLRLGEDENEYVKVINKSITKEGITVRLNESILNNDELIISITTKSENKIKRNMEISREKGSNLYINGKLINSSESSTAMKSGKKNIDEVMFFDLDTAKYKGVVNVKLELSDLIVYKVEKSGDLTKQKIVEGPFIFEFELNTDEINKDIKTVNLNETLKISDNTQVTLDKYVYTPLFQKIYFTSNIKSSNKDNEDRELFLKGKDDLGEDVEFYLYSSYNGKGQLISDTEIKNIKKSAKHLTLTAYEVSYIENKDKKTIERNLKEIKSGIRIELGK